MPQKMLPIFPAGVCQAEDKDANPPLVTRIDDGAWFMRQYCVLAKDVDDNRVVLYTHEAKNSNLTPRIIPRPSSLVGKFEGRVFDEWNPYPSFLKDLVNMATTMRYLQLLGFIRLSPA